MLSTLLILVTAVTGVWSLTSIKPMLKKQKKQVIAINGVVELPKDQAVLIEPFDTVTVQGFYRSQPEVNDAITKAAKAKGAYSFYIVRQPDANQGGNQRITAFIYKKDAKKRSSRAPDVILVIPKQDVQLCRRWRSREES